MSITIAALKRPSASDGTAKTPCCTPCPVHPRPPAGLYGAQLPIPEELRTDDTVAWQTIAAFAAGQRHTFKIKTLGPALWRKSGAACPLRLVVIAPMG